MKFILPALIISLLYACSPYQVMTISSTNVTQNKAQEFVIENDSFRLVYNFNGENAPMRMTFTNKLTKPLRIDWKRSALIVNHQAISYAALPSVIRGSLSANSINWGAGYTSTSTKINALAPQAMELEFIPGGSFVIRELAGITNQAIIEVPDKQFTDSKMAFKGAFSRRVKIARFLADNSPLVFTSYLTLLGEDPAGMAREYQQHFFVSELIKNAPERNILLLDTTANRFFVSEYREVQKFYQTGYVIVNGRAMLSNPALPPRPGGTFVPARR